MKTRRDFLRSTVLGASAAWTVPMFVERTFGQLHDASKDLAIQPITGKDDTILVVLQLALSSRAEDAATRLAALRDFDPGDPLVPALERWLAEPDSRHSLDAGTPPP